MQEALEVILTRQLAEYLALPVFLVDPDGNLLFYNEPAERVLGQRFDETGSMPREEWGTAFAATNADGKPVALDDLPLARAIRTRRPVLGRMFIRGLDDVQREIEIAAFPLIGLGKRMHGGVAMFWEVKE